MLHYYLGKNEFLIYDKLVKKILAHKANFSKCIKIYDISKSASLYKRIAWNLSNTEILDKLIQLFYNPLSEEDTDIFQNSIILDEMPVVEKLNKIPSKENSNIAMYSM